MTNLEKYRGAFIAVFGVGEDKLPGLKYQDVEQWDSVGHMQLITALEEAFDIMMEMDDVIDFSSYEHGMELLSRNYGVEF